MRLPEAALLAAVQRLEPNAFAANIARDVSRTLAAHITLAEIMMGLEKAENAGHVVSRLSSDKRFIFFLTDKGKKYRKNLPISDKSISMLPSGVKAT